MIELRTILVAVLLVSVSSTAWALDPEEADLVDMLSPDVPSFNPADPDLDDDAIYVGKSNCETMLNNTSRIKVTFGTSFNPQQNDDLIERTDVFAVERDSRARIDCEADLCLAVDEDEDINYTTSGVVVDILFSYLLEAGEEEDCEGYDKEFFIRLTVEDSLEGADSTENADVKIIIDNVEPAAPADTTASATESRINVSFSGSDDSDVRRYWVYYSTASFEGGQVPGDVSGLQRKLLGDETEGNVSVALDPTQPLFVAIAAEDYAGNLSALSGVQEASVTETDDFWESYKKAGGAEDGGCATATGTPAPWLVLIGIALFGIRRRRRRFAMLTVATLLLLTPLTASAESPTWGAMELKLAGYYPSIDEEFGDSGPFSDTFGSKSLILGELEVDGWLWQKFGKLGLAGHIGYSRVKGGAVAAEDTANEDEAEAIEDTTAFTLFPMRISVVYRFDWLAQNTRIPLSFGIKAGPDFYRWRITDSNKQTAEFDGSSGSGWTSGWHIAGGLQLLLDVIDTSTAAAFDLHWGVNNSYFFVEYMFTQIDDFGGGGFDLSDDLWLFGLSFEF